MAQTMTRRLGAILVAMALVVAACSDSGGSATTSTPRDGTRVTPVTNPDQPFGGGVAPRLFGLKLSEGEAQLAPPPTTPVVDGAELDQQRIDEIIARLPKWLDAELQQPEFNWPVQSTPPPRTGNTVVEAFPPSGTTPVVPVDNGPLEVLRVQPEGDVPIAPYVSITFNQPMVPVGTVTQVSAQNVPVTISPDVAGTWQWIGTRTLRFDAASDAFDRLPMATTFTVTVPAGTESAAGGSLAQEQSFEFATPPPKVVTLSPQGDQILRDQIFLVEFDQRIDPSDVLETIHVKASGDDVDVRLATADEIAADETAAAMTLRAEDGRWLAFRSDNELPSDAAITITVGPGTPSAEGPATTTETQTFAGRTYAALKVVRSSCAYDNQCPPGSQLYIEFNNVLDISNNGNASDADAVKVTPDLAGLSVSVNYTTVQVSGATQPNTDYTITIPGSFTDIYGQTLGKDTEVTIEVGSALPSIQQYEMITTLDPFLESQQLSLLTVGQDQLRVRVFAADPTNFDDYLSYYHQLDDVNRTDPAWDVLSDETITLEGDENSTLDTPINLAEILRDKPGQVIVLIEPVPLASPNSNDYWQNRPVLTWAQSTSLGVDTLSDATRSVVWATDLRTGAPLSDVQLTLAGGAVGATDGEGLATFDLPPPRGNFGPVLVATRNDETAIVVLQSTFQDVRDDLRWYVFDDRQVYRPGETMQVKGWLRRLTTSTDAQLKLLDPDATVSYVIMDSYGVELLKGVAALGALGGFDLELVLPDTANVGPASLSLSLVDEPGLTNAGNWHQFQIQEFRRPEFEVTTRPESTQPFLSTRPATLAATGEYYAGGPLANAPADWSVSTTPTTYSPPGWDEFTFGIWIPWWFAGNEFYGDSFSASRSGPCCGPSTETTVKTYQGTTDGSGTHYLNVDFEGTDGTLPDLPVAISAQATIADVNRQAWSSTTDLLVHAADRYVGLRATRAFVRQGDQLEIEAIVTGIDGDVLSGVSVDVVAGRVESKYVDGEWIETMLDPQTCSVTSGAEATTCQFDTAVGGQYKVRAIVTDERGGRNRTETTAWVSGAESEPTRGVDQQVLTVVPSQETYAVGETAELLVQAPFATGEGLVTVSRNGIRDTIRFQVVDGSAVIQLPITEADVPQLSLNLEVVGAATRTNDDGTVATDVPQRPAYAVGSMTLAVPPVSRTLDVTATPRDTELAPGEATTIDVTVKDAKGAPVEGAEFAVVVVDEAVLALSGYTLTDPLSVFYAPGYDWLNAMYARQQIRLQDPARLRGDTTAPANTVSENPTADTAAASEESTAAPSDADRFSVAGQSGEDKLSADVAGPPVEVRSDFDALALFQPTVITAADGTAMIDVTLPDNLTRYRVMVVAVSGADRFGSAESNITARLPLAVRPSAPRFANFGDAFELPVVLQNQSDAPLAVDVVLETSNLALAGPAAMRVTVPANDRVEVRFPVATAQVGTAGLRVTAVSGDLADSATVELPVYTPATAEAFATYGVIDEGAIDQPLLSPTDVIPGFGGLEVSTSSTSLQALTDAVLYLHEYPYTSTDAYASRILAIAALAEVLDAFDAEGMPTDAEIATSMKKDIAAMVALQNDDGGFSYWRKYDETDPFITVEATHALVLARDAGHKVPTAPLDLALGYIADIESHFPAYYGPQERVAVSSYALWVRALAGDRDAGKAENLYDDHRDDIAVDAMAWLWTVIADGGMRDEIERTLNNRAVETAGAANFTTTYGDSSYLIMLSDRRTDGIVLDALIANAPDSDLVPKVVAGLLANKVKGRWNNVQENAFILLALKSYFDTYESQTPDFVARVWLGDQFAGEHAFKGRETDRATVTIPTAELINAGDTDLVLAKDGSGRMYYRIGLRYAPADLQLDALDRGFVVDRVYEAVDDPTDVSRGPDGTWRVKAGTRVRVTLTMVAESQRTHVALVDPLPAGLESLNPALAVTQTVPADPPTDVEFAGEAMTIVCCDGWWGRWYEHEQLRDDRTEAFTTLLPAGTYTYSYIARATTPGTFVVPPTRAEEMYAPETFGRTATDKMIIE